MIESLQSECELFTVNRDIMKQHFMWELTSFYPLCAMIYTEKGLEINGDEIKRCKELISGHVGWFSDFRGMTYLVLAAKLALEENPNEKFNQVIKLHHIFKLTFWNSPCLPLVAYTVSDYIKEEEYEKTVLRAKEIYLDMKSKYPFLITKEDVGFAALFALSDESNETIIEEMKNCYDILKQHFISARALQALCYALALGKQEAKVKCDKVLYIYRRLKENGCKYGTGMELAALGLLALVTEDEEEAVRQILEVNIYLLSNKGFGAFGIGRAQRLMYAALLVAQNDKNIRIKQDKGIKIDIGKMGLMIAEQVVLAVAITSATANLSSAAAHYS